MKSFVALVLFLAFLSLTGAEESSGLIAPGATPQKLAGDFIFTEGAAADAEGNVFFTDQPNNRILKWSVAGQLSTYLQPAGRANGLCFDAAGNLWACADEKNELWRIDSSKKIEVILRGYETKALNGPNDLWIRPDGGLYFSDPYFQRNYWSRQKAEQDKNAVYFLSANRQRLIRVVDDLQTPNGLIGTADGKTLYVTDGKGGKTYRYSIAEDGRLSGKTLFCEMGSDGMTLDEKGNLYLTNKGVTVFDANGKKIEHIPIPEEAWCGNVCFGGTDRKTLFITASKGLYSIRMTVAGRGSQ